MFNYFLLGATNIMLAASTGGDFKEFGDVLSNLFESMFTPLISIAVALCAIWAHIWASNSGEQTMKRSVKKQRNQFGRLSLV